MKRDEKNMAEKESEKRSCCGYVMGKRQETLAPGGLHLRRRMELNQTMKGVRLGSDLFAASMPRIASSISAISSLAATGGKNPHASKPKILDNSILFSRLQNMSIVLPLSSQNTAIHSTAHRWLRYFIESRRFLDAFFIGRLDSTNS